MPIPKAIDDYTTVPSYDCSQAENPFDSAKRRGVEAIVDSTMRAFDEACEKLFTTVRDEAKTAISKYLSGK